MKTLLRAAVGLAAVTAASYGLLAVGLPRASTGDRVGARVLVELERTRAAGAVGAIGGRPFRAACRTVSRRTAVLSLAGGRRLLLHGAHVHALKTHGPGAPASLASRRLASLARAEPEATVAVADLSGSHKLYSIELAHRLLAIRGVGGRRVTVDGRPAYSIALGHERPRVELLVDRRTLRPLFLRYRSRRVSGWARILAAPPGSQQGC